MATTTNKATHDLLRKYGYSSTTVEQWVTFRGGASGPGYRKDFMGFADILAWRPLMGEDLKRLCVTQMNWNGVFAVQTCGASGLSAHIKKVTVGPVGEDLKLWLLAGNRFEIWAWGQRGARGQRKVYLPAIRKVIVERVPHSSKFKLTVEEDSELLLLGYDPATEKRTRKGKRIA